MIKKIILKSGAFFGPSAFKSYGCAVILLLLLPVTPIMAGSHRTGESGNSSGNNTYNHVLGNNGRDLTPVKGTVADAEGKPLIGVSIKVKGTTKGVLSDLNGQFTIDIQPGTTLVVSYVGYADKEVIYNKSGDLKIVLTVYNPSLDDVVVVGYGTQKKKDLTGAITSIKADDVTLNPSGNPMIALQGKVPGLDITKSSGEAGAGVNMQLRGTRSLSASGNPLVLIDGMPGSYSTLNPNDIESIDVLKDASSTAIYGASGANGVILITTKSGKEGRTQVNYDAYVGYSGWSMTPKVHRGDSYFNTKKLAQQEAGSYTTDDQVLSTEVYDAYQRGEDIDRVKAIMKNNMTQNHSLSLSGGTKKTRAYFSLNYNNESGQYKGDAYKVLSSTIKIDHKVTDWFSAGLNTQMFYNTGSSAYSKIENALRAIPYGTIFNEDGSLKILPVAGDEQTVNFLLDTDPDVYRDQSNNFSLYFNPYVRFTPLKGLSFESRISGQLSYARSNTFVGIGSYQYYWAEGANATGTTPTVAATIVQNRNYNYRWENILTYEFNLGADHNFKLTGVSTYDHNQSEFTNMSNNQFSSNKYLWENLGAGASPSVGSSYTMSRSLGLIGRLNYSYKDRYLFQASIREDGSSKLADGHKWAAFPAVSAGWRISEEDFMQGTKSWLSNLKLRVGYGVSGTASIDPYSSVSNIEAGFYSLSGQKVNKYNYSQLLANADLTWERSYNTNIGIDADFLKNRIRFTGDFYITNTDGVIWTKNIPVTNGAYNAGTLYQTRVNIAKTKNTGIELGLYTANIAHKKFSWSSALTFSANKEMITKLAEKSSTPVVNGDYALLVGQPINSYYSYKILGVWQNGEEAQAAAFGEEPGDLKIEVPNLVSAGDNAFYKLDANGNYVTGDDGNKILYNADNPYAISDNDRQIVGHNSPDFSLGFQNTFSYANFDLTIYAYMRYGQTIDYSLLTDYDPSGSDNFPSYFNYWTSSNPSNDFPALNASKQRQDYVGFYGLSYVDGSFLKIKNITLGYTLPDITLKKMQLDKLRFYGTITNPLVVAKSHLLKQYDPEQNGSLDFPLTKQIVLGLNLSF
ncbi:TonB-linked outer membrane protein, SusC/RagA family [Arachidicoccus rhizosphaerae]|uniref:TonB-linked outer membrane protein, SusC/RagA family n=1 Tax=Arachidicoccus rhizosphaerae TaxID=551991 RepID=A0A1H4AJN5_9BACT|nr:TonB-dependent receptor [Arachidicoccus rhizosphaerae]SEA35864.1 TonB-linked outer membrane protein, SusC/RagA family [Arachidicoccus rhizosphaerae]